MPVRVAVSDPLPAYRLGVLATLGQGGFDPETSAELLDWVGQSSRPVVLLTLATDADWSLLARIRHEHAEATIIALLPDASVSAYVRAMAAGAVTALPRDAAMETVRQAFEEVLRGFSVLPVQVVQALAAPHKAAGNGPQLTAPEVSWLRELAGGATVGQLAERSGYSERAMFRQLHELYAKLRVKNRTEALLAAHRKGLL
jgi:DNA-binding NarL/FixJ family response regulator